METEYYTVRQDVLDLIPDAAKVVVDVGCGPGVTARALKAQRPDVTVYGVEPLASEAETARMHLDGVLSGVVEGALPADWERPDAVLFADVLEHMVDPWRDLKAWYDRLPAGGHIVASIPNVMHYSCWAPLLWSGRWEYTDSGVMDRTHLRFFTRDTALQLVEGAGFEVLSCKRNTTTPPFLFGRTLERFLRSVGTFRVSKGLRPADLVTLQYVIAARKP